MKCPKCGEDNNMVYKTDESFFLTEKRRGRLCRKCKFIFETVERATGEPYHVRKSDPNQLSLLADTALERYDTSKEKNKRIRALVHELRSLTSTIDRNANNGAPPIHKQRVSGKRPRVE